MSNSNITNFKEMKEAIMFANEYIVGGAIFDTMTLTATPLETGDNYYFDNANHTTTNNSDPARTNAVDITEHLYHWSSSPVIRSSRKIKSRRQDRTRLFYLFGDFGSGKSGVCKSLIKRLYDEYEFSRYSDTTAKPILPIYLNLRVLTGIYGSVEFANKSLAELIEVMFCFTGIPPIDGSDIIKLVRQYPCVIVFDGFDEAVQKLGKNQQNGFLNKLLSVLPDAQYGRDLMRIVGHSVEESTIPDSHSRIVISCRSQLFESEQEQTTFTEAFYGTELSINGIQNYQAYKLASLDSNSISYEFKEYFKRLRKQQRQKLLEFERQKEDENYFERYLNNELSAEDVERDDSVDDCLNSNVDGDFTSDLDGNRAKKQASELNDALTMIDTVGINNFSNSSFEDTLHNSADIHSLQTIDDVGSFDSVDNVDNDFLKNSDRASNNFDASNAVLTSDANIQPTQNLIPQLDNDSLDLDNEDVKSFLEYLTNLSTNPLLLSLSKSLLPAVKTSIDKTGSINAAQIFTDLINKLMQRDSRKSVINIKEKQKILGALAEKMWQQRTTFISLENLRTFFFDRYPDYRQLQTGIDTGRIEIETAFQDLHSSIIVRDDCDMYAFCQPLIFDYFVAVGIFEAVLTPKHDTINNIAQSAVEGELAIDSLIFVSHMALSLIMRRDSVSYNHFYDNWLGVCHRIIENAKDTDSQDTSVAKAHEMWEVVIGEMLVVKT